MFYKKSKIKPWKKVLKIGLIILGLLWLWLAIEILIKDLTREIMRPTTWTTIVFFILQLALGWAALWSIWQIFGRNLFKTSLIISIYFLLITFFLLSYLFVSIQDSFYFGVAAALAGIGVFGTTGLRMLIMTYQDFQKHQKSKK